MPCPTLHAGESAGHTHVSDRDFLCLGLSGESAGHTRNGSAGGEGQSTLTGRS